VWHSIKYSKSGIYIDTLETSIGCDSIVTLDLTIKCDEIEVDSLVQKDSLTTYNDIAKLDSLEEIQKDSIVYTQNNFTYTICKGDSLLIQGFYQFKSGEYQDTLVSKSKGELDSLIVSTLIVKESKDTSLSITVCDSLVWHSIKYSKSGIYIDTLETSIGCDSIVTLNLTIKCDEIEVDSLVQKDSLKTYNDIAKLDFEEENHKVVVVHHQDGKDFFYQDGVLIKEDSLGMLGQANNEDVFNSRDSLSFINKENKNAPIFIYGFGKTDKVSKDWGNYYFEKESFEKAVYRFSKVKNKDVDVLRKLGKSYLSLNLLDSSEYYYGTLAKKTNSPVDWYNYSHILYLRDKFDEAEEVRAKYANSSNEKRAEIFKSNSSHKELLSSISKVDLFNLSINTKNSDFGAFAVKNDSANSYDVLFTSADEFSIKRIKKSKFIRPDQPTYDIFKTTLNYSTSELTNPVSLSGELNDEYQEGPAIMSYDQKTIYFTRSNSVDAEDESIFLSLFGVGVDNINFQDSVFGLTVNNDHYSVMHPTLSVDGKEIYFSSDMPGGYGGLDIYYCKILGNINSNNNSKKLIGLSKPINLGNNINTEGNEVFPFYMDSNTLFYASDGRIGLGGLDIFMSHNFLDSSLITIDNIGIPFNSPKDDFSFFLSQDIKFGFLSSNRDGGKGDDDIYSFKTNISVSKGVDDYYSMVSGQKLEVLSSSVLDNDFLNDTLKNFMSDDIFHKAKLTSFPSNGKVSFNENGTFVYTPKDDKVEKDSFNYKILYEDVPHEDITVYISSLALTKPVAVDDHYLIKKGEDFLVDYKNGTLHNDYDPSDDDLSTFIIKNPSHGKINYLKDGSFTYHAEDYFVKSDTFTYVVSDGQLFDTAMVTLARLVSGVDIATIIEINPIYFDVNKSNIREDAAVELNKIVDVMNDYPEMQVELGSHTDCRASKAYNRSLSDRRAKSSASYIKNKITNPKRLYGKGYGESKLKNNCECEGSNIVPCSEEEHQDNRRTEFVIIKM
jgi:outer membrane protein OmpA-like peptidoglycan-associated protein